MKLVFCREINPKSCSLQKKSFLLSGFKERVGINYAHIVGRFEEIAQWKTCWGLSIVNRNGESGIIYLNPPLSKQRKNGSQMIPTGRFLFHNVQIFHFAKIISGFDATIITQKKVLRRGM